MSHASQQYAFTEPRTVKRAQVKPSEREHQTSSSAPRVSLAPAADRTLDILEFIASNGQTQAATLARELGIPRSTVYQLLEILERHGLVTRLAEQRAYGIGLKTFELGSAYSRQHRVSQVAHPVLARLVDETGENGHLAVLHGNEIIYVIEERAAHRPPLVSGGGVRLPVTCPPPGEPFWPHSPAIRSARYIPIVRRSPTAPASAPNRPRSWRRRSPKPGAPVLPRNTAT